MTAEQFHFTHSRPLSSIPDRTRTQARPPDCGTLRYERTTDSPQQVVVALVVVAMDLALFQVGLIVNVGMMTGCNARVLGTHDGEEGEKYHDGYNNRVHHEA